MVPAEDRKKGRTGRLGKRPEYDLQYRTASFSLRTIFRLNGGVDVRGIENIPPEGGVLVAANHISYLDPPLLGAIIPRRATFMARRGLFEIPVLKWLISLYAYPVDRERPRPSTIKETVQRLKRGEMVVMFPEGRRSETGQMQEARRGVGMIVSLSKVPVLPVYIWGTDRALPPGAKWLTRVRVMVVFDKPVYYTSTIGQDLDRHSLHEELSRSVMDAIGNLKRRYEDTGS